MTAKRKDAFVLQYSSDFGAGRLTESGNALVMPEIT